MNTSSKTKSVLGFVVWFSIAVVTVVFTIFILNGMRLNQTGQDSYSGLLLIPNLILLVACAGALLILRFTRPKSGTIDRRVLMVTAISWGIGVFIVFLNPKLWGGYTLRIEVVDSNRKPIPGIVVDTLEQKASLFSVFLPEDVDRTVTTNTNGIAEISTNVFQSIGGLINEQFGPVGHGIEDKDFRSADFKISPVGDRQAVVGIDWDKAGNRQGWNDNHYTSSPFDPGNNTLVIFLPPANGDDHFDYEHEAFGSSH